MAEAHREEVSKRGVRRRLQQLTEGTRVWVQDQMSRKWDRSGTIAEVLGNRQYTIMMDGSGRLSRRNRRHLKIISGQQQTGEALPSTSTNSQPVPGNQREERPQRSRRPPNRLIYEQ